MPTLVAKKPPFWAAKIAKQASSLLTDPIRNAPDWKTAKRLMEVNHKVMQLCGYWRLSSDLSWSYVEFRNFDTETIL